jgi:hypothetical protein
MARRITLLAVTWWIASVSHVLCFTPPNSVMNSRTFNHKSFLTMDRNGEEHVVESNKDQYTPQEANDKKSKNESYLEVLALSVTVFFLATIWLTNGQIFSDFSSKYDYLGGKASFYKSVDAESVLQQDFNRESSSVMF